MNPAAHRIEDNASGPVLYTALELSNKRRNVHEGLISWYSRNRRIYSMAQEAKYRCKQPASASSSLALH
jgi:hypothetical protein